MFLAPFTDHVDTFRSQVPKIAEIFFGDFLHFGVHNEQKKNPKIDSLFLGTLGDDAHFSKNLKLTVFKNLKLLDQFPLPLME